MSDSITLAEQNAVEAIRAKMLGGRAHVPVFAKAIERTERTVYSYIAAGMPTEYIGRTPYVVVDPALEWLRSRRRRQTEPRGRGRPRKAT
jgi:hypothetical protein